MKARALPIAIAVAVAVWMLWPSLHQAGRIPVPARVASTEAAPERFDAGSAPMPLQQFPPVRPRVVRHDAPAPAHAAFPPLPPAHTQLSLVYSQLKAQAAAGDARAQCRLAYELKRCADAPKLAKFANGLIGKPELVDPDDLRRIRTRAEHATAACKGFTPDPGDEVWRYTLQAALGGNDAAAVNFALGLMAGLDIQRPLATLDGWIAYQQFASVVLQRAIDDGYPPAYSAAARLSYGPQFGAAILPTDHVRSAAYSLALASIATPQARSSLQAGVQRLHLSDADLARASLLAADLSAKLKPERPFGKAEDIEQLLGEDGSGCDD